MTRTIAMTIASIFLSTALLAAGHPQKGKKHKESSAAVASVETGGPGVAVSVVWGAREIEMIRRYYAPQYRSLPPGLQKKYARTGQLPPGWQKKMAPLPASLERECAVLPAGYHRGVIDAHAVIYNSHGAIVDVAVLY